MGMYDRFKSSYDLGEQFTNVICQTKTIDDFGGTMTEYWLSPNGYLGYSDFVGTSELKTVSEEDPEYNSKLKWLNFKWVPTGKKGKFKIYPITKYVEIYPENWKGEWNERPTMRLHFRNGKLQDYETL